MRCEGARVQVFQNHIEKVRRIRHVVDRQIKTIVARDPSLIPQLKYARHGRTILGRAIDRGQSLYNTNCDGAIEFMDNAFRHGIHLAEKLGIVEQRQIKARHGLLGRRR